MADIGELIAGRYRLVDRIAAGGMGVVWEGRDELLGRRVAVKQVLLQPGLSEAEALLARNRVIREARITARLHHPHAVTIYDVVDDGDYPCLIMQFVPSNSLNGLLLDRGTLPTPE
ncbi:MAG TPA: protein kinase, partial [Mycobacterium sp.]